MHNETSSPIDTLTRFGMHCCLVGLFTAQPSWAVEHVVFLRDGNQQKVSGRLEVAASDGGVLVMAQDGVLWAITPEELIKRHHDDDLFEASGQKELENRLLSELPQGFQTYTTANYLICYNTPKVYAQWCGALYERLFRAYRNFWNRRGFKLHDPEFPLIALVMDNRKSFLEVAKSELGEAAGSIIGYYSLRTNRVIMYDLTGAAAGANQRRERLTTREINQMLGLPSAERTVATIVHEATHQIAFNCGMHVRYADIPIWLSEGLAMYFETPDLRSSKGWRNIGGVNYTRLDEFRRYAERRPSNALQKLIGGNERFRHAREAADAYPEAWALTYYLLRNHPKQFIQYMNTMSKKGPLLTDDRQRRLTDFHSAFGNDLEKLDATFMKQIQRIK